MQVEITKTPEAFADVGGVKLCYDSFGDVAAPTILLVMGLGAPMTAWDERFCATLAARGFRVVRFDNRDIGRSSRFDAPVNLDFADLMLRRMRGERIDAPYTLRDMSADAVGLLDHLGVARAHVVGASMGGMIAQEMAIHFPDRLATLASVMSSTGNPLLPPPTPEAAAVLFSTPPTTREAFIENFARTWRVLRVGSFPEDEANDRARAELAFARGLNPMGVARQMLAIFASGDRRPQLARLRVPTLVVHGDVDPLVRLAAGEETARAIPGARLVVVQGMGHAFPIALWPPVIDAIARHAAAPAA